MPGHGRCEALILARGYDGVKAHELKLAISPGKVNSYSTIPGQIPRTICAAFPPAASRSGSHRRQTPAVASWIAPSFSVPHPSTSVNGAAPSVVEQHAHTIGLPCRRRALMPIARKPLISNCLRN